MNTCSIYGKLSRGDVCLRTAGENFNLFDLEGFLASQNLFTENSRIVPIDMSKGCVTICYQNHFESRNKAISMFYFQKLSRLMEYLAE
jgi:hypothetical protein